MSACPTCWYITWSGDHPHYGFFTYLGYTAAEVFDWSKQYGVFDAVPRDDPHVVFAKMCPDDMTVSDGVSRFLFSSVAVPIGMMILPGRKNPPNDST